MNKSAAAACSLFYLEVALDAEREEAKMDLFGELKTKRNTEKQTTSRCCAFLIALQMGIRNKIKKAQQAETL